MGGRGAWTRAGAIAVAAVMLLATSGCATPGETEAGADSSPLYANLAHGTCRTLPFELLEQSVGRPRGDFGAWRPNSNSTELVVLADTFAVNCGVETTTPEDSLKRTGMVTVFLGTYPTAAEAAAVFETFPKGEPGRPDPPASDVDVDRLTWLDSSTTSSWATDIDAMVLDRNLVLTMDVRTGEKEVDAPASDAVRAATSSFLAESVRRIRSSPPRPVHPSMKAKAGPAYPAPVEGFCQRIPFDLIRGRLNAQHFGPPEERESKGSRSCSLRTYAGMETPSGTATLWVRHHGRAQQALDFHQAHLPITPTPTAPDGLTLEVDALDWSRRPPAEGRDGVHAVRIVSGNLYLYFDVTGHPDNNPPTVDPAMAPMIAEFLRAALASLRG